MPRGVVLLRLLWVLKLRQGRSQDFRKGGGPNFQNFRRFLKTHRISLSFALLVILKQTYPSKKFVLFMRTVSHLTDFSAVLEEPMTELVPLDPPVFREGLKGTKSSIK